MTKHCWSPGPAGESLAIGLAIGRRFQGRARYLWVVLPNVVFCLISLYANFHFLAGQPGVVVGGLDFEMLVDVRIAGVPSGMLGPRPLPPRGNFLEIPMPTA